MSFGDSPSTNYDCLLMHPLCIYSNQLLACYLHPVPLIYIALDDGEKATPIPEPADPAGIIQEPIVPVDTNNMATQTVGQC